MKVKIYVFLIMTIMLMSVSGYSQTQSAPVSEKIMINSSDLTPAQLLKIETDAREAELKSKLQTYGNWVGVGGEIGNAIKEGLNAVVDVSAKFGKTDVGKFTMIMVAYKIMGKDIVRIIIGLLFFIVFSIFMFRFYRNSYVTTRKCVESNGIKFCAERSKK